MLHARPPSPSELSVAPPASRRLRPLPLVVEPSASSSADLSTAIGANGAELDRLLRVHGALLFRNWRVPDTASFAAAAGAMRTMGLSSMADYAPAEPGRDERVHLEGATVWHTNELRRSGNYWAPEVVPHTENFYALERPACVAFFCEGRPPWVGGETALFYSQLFYSQLVYSQLCPGSEARRRSSTASPPLRPSRRASAPRSRSRRPCGATTLCAGSGRGTARRLTRGWARSLRATARRCSWTGWTEAQSA